MKKRTLINLILFPVALTLILVTALLTLDLNPYRDQIIWSLEQAFSRPVELGSIELSFHNGLTLELRDLKVGTEEDANHFSTGRAHFKPQLLGLLRGQLTFNTIELEKPSLQITLGAHEEPREDNHAAPKPLFANLPGLKQLSLQDANVLLRNLSPNLPQLTLSHINLTLRGIHPGQTCQVRLSGELGNTGTGTPVSLSARIQIPQASETWLDRQLDIKFAAQQVNYEDWQKLAPKALSGLLPATPFDLHLSINNSDDGKLSAAATLENSRQDGTCLTPNLTLSIANASLGGSYDQNSPLYDLTLAGQGQLQSCGEELANFNMQQRLTRDADQSRFNSHLSAHLVTATLLDMLAPKSSGLSGRGSVPLTLDLSGGKDRIDWKLHGDLGEFALYRNDLMLKTPGIPGTLEAQGELGTGRPLTSGHFKLGGLQANLSGNYTETGKSFELQVPETEIASLGEIFPALAQWDLHGSLNGIYRLQNSPQGWARNGTFTLSNVAAVHPYPLGPVRNTQARLEFHDNRLNFSCTPLGLGESQLHVVGEIADLSQPVFAVHAETPSMLARDLVFKRPGAHLNDLAGNLLIDARGIEFVDARVSLDNGTRADVDGRLDFPTRRLHLNARASYGHIDEVIRLFSGPARWNQPDQEHPRPHRKGPHLKVIVEAKVEEGEIGDVSFEQAHGTVTVEDGNVEVYPLSFKGQGQGTATARVYYQRRPDQVGWLRVSGHLHQFESSTIYRQYWKQEGEIKGPLDTDFFLQGPSDNNFFSRGDGAVYLEISDGSLRRFNALSKAFSLLNVSQLIKGDLPDVSGHGMKFNLAKGTLSFGGGYAYFDDLAIFSNSMNMSMVGRVGLAEKKADYILGVQPLQTVDKVVSNIPLVGWLLTGDEKTLFTVHFQVKGPLGDPSVVAIPGSSLGSGILGIFQRTLQLPGKLIK